MTKTNDLTQTARIARTAGQHLAYFGEMEFSENGLPYSLTTLGREKLRP